MDPKKTALVLIEYQNDFTTPGGTLHDAVKGVMAKTNMLANTIETVEKARAAGATIVFVPITFAEGYGEDARRALWHPQGRQGLQVLRQGQLGRRHHRQPARRRPATW